MCMFFWWLTFPDAVQIVLIVFPTADVICLLTDARCTHVCSHFFPLPPLVPSSDSPLPLFALSFPPSQLSTATGLNPTTRGTDAPSRLFSPTVLSHSPHVPPSQTPTSLLALCSSSTACIFSHRPSLTRAATTTTLISRSLCAFVPNLPSLPIDNAA
jgi:hypothetical protein